MKMFRCLGVEFLHKDFVLSFNITMKKFFFYLLIMVHCAVFIVFKVSNGLFSAEVHSAQVLRISFSVIIMLTAWFIIYLFIHSAIHHFRKFLVMESIVQFSCYRAFIVEVSCKTVRFVIVLVLRCVVCFHEICPISLWKLNPFSLWGLNGFVASLASSVAMEMLLSFS
jgi:hypothetical protein